MFHSTNAESVKVLVGERFRIRSNVANYEKQLRNVGIEYEGEIKKGEEGVDALSKL